MDPRLKLNYYKKNEAYLQGQLGNPEGPAKPNKKYFGLCYKK